MQNLAAKTDILIKKARKLAEHGKRLDTLKHELENEVKSLKLSLEAEQDKNKELNNQIKIIKLAQNISSRKPDEPANAGAELSELKRKINEYIREIDHCIAMIND